MPEIVISRVQPNQIVIQEEQKTVTVTTPINAIVEVAATGPQGPVGAGAYVHSQSSPSTTWTINHNMGIYPAVELLDTGGQEIDGEISHTSINQTIVRLNPPSAGIARLI